MLKKLLVASSILIASTSTAFASAAFYVAPSVSYQNIQGDGAQYSGIEPKLAIGFGGFFRDSIYLAGELFGSPASITIRNSESDTTGFNVKPKYTIGAAILPGFDIDGTLMAFLRIGIAYTHFDQLDATRPGYVLGGGGEYRVDNNWSLRGEYVYIGYSSIDNTTPRDQEGVIGLVYRFI